ncbi:MAG TPA: helix-turn-helix domain-containing protein [Candidatus Saccharimonadales bacterium]|nr:helix-turn-helix domain-containing protein [Candidatus Saccharimonadales bacterium]
MKRADNKSHCPVNFALESFGDPWTLLIVRDIAYFGKKTYGDFLESEEAIATSVLASRLIAMEQKGILLKTQHPTDRRKEIYTLTEKGLDLIPVILEMSGWATHYDPHTGAPKQFVAAVYANRDAMFALVRETVQAGGSIFVGPNSVVRKMAAQ